MYIRSYITICLRIINKNATKANHREGEDSLWWHFY
jgi:hypothetical protein